MEVEWWALRGRRSGLHSGMKGIDGAWVKRGEGERRRVRLKGKGRSRARTNQNATTTHGYCEQLRPPRLVRNLGDTEAGHHHKRTFEEPRGFSFGIGEELGSGIDGEARENAIACLTVRGLGLASWMSQKPD